MGRYKQEGGGGLWHVHTEVSSTSLRIKEEVHGNKQHIKAGEKKGYSIKNKTTQLDKQQHSRKREKKKKRKRDKKTEANRS